MPSPTTRAVAIGNATIAIGTSATRSTTMPAVETGFTQRSASLGAQRRITRPIESGASTVATMIEAIETNETFAPKTAAAIGTKTTARIDATTKSPIV